MPTGLFWQGYKAGHGGQNNEAAQPWAVYIVTLQSTAVAQLQRRIAHLPEEEE